MDEQNYRAEIVAIYQQSWWQTKLFESVNWQYFGRSFRFSLVVKKPCVHIVTLVQQNALFIRGTAAPCDPCMLTVAAAPRGLHKGTVCKSHGGMVGVVCSSEHRDRLMPLLQAGSYLAKLCWRETWSPFQWMLSAEPLKTLRCLLCAFQMESCRRTLYSICDSC